MKWLLSLFKRKAPIFIWVPDEPAVDFKPPVVGPIQGKPDVVFKDEAGNTVAAWKFKKEK
jgi:hypothetical protein